MKDFFYTYSVLKYKHSALLDESINVGLIIYFSSTKSFVFKFSKNLSRIKSIYDNVPDRVIKHYLKQIEDLVSGFNHKDDLFLDLEIASSFDSFLNKYLLPIDSSSLQFSKSKFNLLNNIDGNLIQKSLISRYLIDYDFENKLKLNNHKEPFLLKKFYSYLDGLDFNKINLENKKFHKDYIVRNETGNEFKFDYAWQNGTLNLVKPISFDLKESKSIAEKAYKNLGQFIDLENEATNLGLRYDLLIAKPENKVFFKEYEHALKLLDTLKNSELILEDEIENYSKRAIKALIES